MILRKGRIRFQIGLIIILSEPSIKLRSRVLYFLRRRLHPASSGNHLGPEGDPPQPEWDGCLSSLEASPALSEKETEGSDDRLSTRLSATYFSPVSSYAL